MGQASPGRGSSLYDASSHANSAWGGERAGANVTGSLGTPSALTSMFASAGSVTTAMTLRRPPQGHCSTSSANTRRNRSAHGSRRERDDGAVELVVDASEPPLQAAFGAASMSVGTRARSFARCLLAGPNTPLYLTRCRRGTRRARRSRADANVVARVNLVAQAGARRTSHRAEP